MTGEEQVNLSNKTLKIAAGVCLLLACVGVYLSPIRGWLTAENLAAGLEMISAVWYAPVLFIVAFAVSCVLFLPASVFIVSAGVIWGGWPGSLYALAGAVAGAFLSFIVSRFIGGDILSKLGKSGAQLARALENAGFSTLLVLRLIPFFPFPVFNYGAGVSGVKLRDFMLSTTLGLVPAIVVITFSAEALMTGLLTKQDALLRLVVVSFSFLALVGIPLLFRRRAARALHLEAEVASSETD
jgi:uncharacterized membrane protein YdjX (TVP38/TMEM64 family)